MKKPVMIVAYDVGTTGVKTCLFELKTGVKLVASAVASYDLFILENGGAEQEPLDWWHAICSTTRILLKKTETAPENISGITFCSQMQALVIVDQKGEALRRAMTYMDQRGWREMQQTMSHGIKISGINFFKLLRSIRETGAVSASVKDPVWKYKWVKNNEPAIYSRIYKWLDVKEFLICRCSGRFIMTEDSAFATLLYGIRAGNRGWSEKICKMLGVNTDHLPEIKKSTDQVGQITPDAAVELGLAPGTPVFGGGGDASLIGIGAGAVFTGDTHIYAGTSGWVSTVVDKPVLDPFAMIAAIVGARPGKYNYFAEMETAGKCLEWVKDHLVLDRIGINNEQSLEGASIESTRLNIYDMLTRSAGSAPAGSNGLFFTPWLHGNRCPFEDPNARGIFFNINLNTGKQELIRSVLEGICYHLRWMLEAQDKKVKTSEAVRFVGGGALSDLTCQILADISGRTIETVDNPQNVGAVGAALVAGLGLGIIPSFDAIKEIIAVKKYFSPDLHNRAVYDRAFPVFKKLYKTNKKLFREVNRAE